MRMWFLFWSVMVCAPLYAQKEYAIRTIVFYNLENLFDTKNDTLVFDDGRTPDGTYQWTAERYQKKIGNIAKVITEIGVTSTKNGPDIIGLCEVENASVIEDLINHKLLRSHDYGMVHYDSPDERGIDVALLYKKDAFLPTASKSHRLLLFNEDGYRDYTRDQLLVEGFLDGEKFYFLVNHWPSRSGGELRSRPFRIKAAQLTKRIMDSIRRDNVKAKIISMGDFNDDPVDQSLKKVLSSTGKRKQLDSLSLYNPMEKLFRKGVGTLAYRDKWNLFDQFLITPSALDNANGYFFWKAGIFDVEWLKNQDGRFKGYPFRTYVGTTYQGGYADHFPVYLYLIKQASPDPSKGGE